MTLDGTRTFVVGSERPVVIDPGPEDAAHLDALEAALAGRTPVAILLTHAHPDHAAGARELARRTGAGVWMARGALRRFPARWWRCGWTEGDAVETDVGARCAPSPPPATPPSTSPSSGRRAAPRPGERPLRGGSSDGRRGYYTCVPAGGGSRRLPPLARPGGSAGARRCCIPRTARRSSGCGRRSSGTARTAACGSSRWSEALREHPGASREELVDRSLRRRPRPGAAAGAAAGLARGDPALPRVAGGLIDRNRRTYNPRARAPATAAGES